MPIPYKLIVQLSVARDMKSVPKGDRLRILRRVESLPANPRPPGCVKIDDPATYRVRQGDYRIVYEIDDHARIVTIFKIGHRREVYR